MLITVAEVALAFTLGYCTGRFAPKPHVLDEIGDRRMPALGNTPFRIAIIVIGIVMVISTALTIEQRTKTDRLINCLAKYEEEYAVAADSRLSASAAQQDALADAMSKVRLTITPPDSPDDAERAAEALAEYTMAAERYARTREAVPYPTYTCR